MRHRLAFAAFSLACASVFPLVPACSSNNGADVGDAGDAAIAPNQLIGQPCDETLADPCAPAPATDYGCFTVACAAGTCIESQSLGGCVTGDNENGDITFFEGGSVDNDAGISSCMSNQDCPGLPATDSSPAVVLVCGFSAFAQCATSGVCVSAEPPHLLDGAVNTACGCDGQPVLYVTDELTSAPVMSSTPCATTSSKDSGSGADSGDGAADGEADAGTEADADADVDADANAGADAGADTGAPADAASAG